MDSIPAFMLLSVGDAWGKTVGRGDLFGHVELRRTSRGLMPNRCRSFLLTFAPSANPHRQASSVMVSLPPAVCNIRKNDWSRCSLI